MKLALAFAVAAVCVPLLVILAAPRHPASIHKGYRWE